jgi:hypothetical protein
MNIFKSEPMVKHSNQVHTTTDYFMFKPIDGNRNKNLLHIKRLQNSMTENYLFTIITVNENYEIIDGQHRFEVIKELKLPLNYVICKGYGLNEVHILNQNSKTWNSDDYLTGYCKLENQDYIKYKVFKDKYNLAHNICIALLSGFSSNTSGSGIKEFYDGEFKIKTWNEAIVFAENLKTIGLIYKGYKREKFIFALLRLLKKGNFELTEFISKLKLQSTLMIDCPTTQQYINLIEQIYNYKRREKVNLRY